MNRLDLLPDELKLYIFEIRDLEIERNVKMIQRVWCRYYAKMNALIKITEKCYYNSLYYPQDPPIFLVLSRDTAYIIEFIERNIKKTDKAACSSVIWRELFKDIHYELIADPYNGGPPGAVYYNRIEIAFNKIKKKIL